MNKKIFKYILPILLFSISMALSYVFNLLKLEVTSLDDSLTLLCGWLSIGTINCLFYFSLLNIFKEKLKKLYKFAVYFICLIWMMGLIFLIVNCFIR